MQKYNFISIYFLIWLKNITFARIFDRRRSALRHFPTTKVLSSNHLTVRHYASSYKTKKRNAT